MDSYVVITISDAEFTAQQKEYPQATIVASASKKCIVQSKQGQEPIMKHNESYSPYNNSRTVWSKIN